MPDEDPIREQMDAPMPTVRELAMVLFRRRRVFVWVSSLVFAAAIAYAIAGARYEANMKVLVRRGRADAPVTAGENAPLDLTRMVITEEELNSEVELLRDDEVLRKVVEQTGLSRRSWLDSLRPSEGEAQRVERAARRLARKLKVESMKKTNLIGVSYAADDPQMAAKVLQSVASVYLEKHMEVHRPGGESPFFEQQTAESRRQLKESQQKLLRFAAAHGVVDAAQQRDLILQKLSDLDASDRQTKIDLAETQQRVEELTRKITTLPERTTTQLHTADNPELLKEMKSNLLDLRLKRIQLLTKFEPSHRLVQEVDKQIAQAETAIAAESLTPVKDETTDKDQHYEWAKSELEKAQVQLKALQAREQATSAEKTKYQITASRLGEDAIAQEDLVNTEKAADENYLLYVKKREEARMDDALDERGIVNVAIAEQPVAPALPQWSAWMVLAVGFVAAGLAGSGAAFVADYVDPVFRGPEDARLCLGVPVLASLPENPKRRFAA
jgi:polysaccharide biosynthesis protein PslE